MRPFLKNEQGLTLVELLAVIIILGILLLIAMPMVGKVIENSRKDAHLADAEMMVNAARLAQIHGEKDRVGIGDSNKKGGFYGSSIYTLDFLIKAGYIGQVRTDYDLLRSCVVFYDNQYFVRLFVADPVGYQVIPRPKAVIKTPHPVQDNSNRYEEYKEIKDDGNIPLNGNSGKKSVALIEDVRGNRDIVRLPQK